MAKSAVEFTAAGRRLLLIYRPRDGVEWVHEKWRRGETLVIKGTFHLLREQLMGDVPVRDSKSGSAVELVDLYTPEEDELVFVVAKQCGDYYHLDATILQVGLPVLLSTQAKPNWRWFSAERSVSILGVVAKLRPSRIVIGGDEPDAIPIVEYAQLIEQFPTPYEIKRYVHARAAAVVRQYTDATVDAEETLRKYVNRRARMKVVDLAAPFREADIAKYELLLERLKQMLDCEDGYSENLWQAQIIQIVRLLNPKYIAALREARVRDSDAGTWRKLDILLVDASGNVDIIEIKRPFSNCIVTTARYRDNHVPLRDLSGAIMQIEKYIRHLNRWGPVGEIALGEQFKDKLPTDFKIRITNPSGIVIMGRDKGLSAEQIRDFEVARRHYRHIVDIVTYDDLIRRLTAVLDQLRG